MFGDEYPKCCTVFGTSFNDNQYINIYTRISQNTQPLGSGHWSDVNLTSMFQVSQFKVQYSSSRVSFRGSIYVQ
jgi:hypothetical protein